MARIAEAKQPPSQIFFSAETNGSVHMVTDEDPSETSFMSAGTNCSNNTSNDQHEQKSLHHHQFRHHHHHPQQRIQHQQELLQQQELLRQQKQQEQEQHDYQEEKQKQRNEHRRRIRRPQQPGKTAKNNERRFVAHNYHDHANDDDEATGQRRRTNLFPIKLHKVLDEPELQGIVSWQPHGRCFLIRKPKPFVSAVLPNFFKQSKLTSFQRQLSLYGFQRITKGEDAGGYYHELFLRGMPFLCYKMNRAIVKGTRIKAASNPDQEPNFYSMSTVTPQHMSNVSSNSIITASSSPLVGGAPIEAASARAASVAVPQQIFQLNDATALQAYLQEQQRQQLIDTMTPLQRLFAEAPATLQPGMFSGDAQLTSSAFPTGNKGNSNTLAVATLQQHPQQQSPPYPQQSQIPVKAQSGLAIFKDNNNNNTSSNTSNTSIMHYEQAASGCHSIPESVQVVHNPSSWTSSSRVSPQQQQHNPQQHHQDHRANSTEPSSDKQQKFQLPQHQPKYSIGYTMPNSNNNKTTSVVSDDYSQNDGDDVLDSLVGEINNARRNNITLSADGGGGNHDDDFVDPFTNEDEPLQRMLATLTEI